MNSPVDRLATLTVQDVMSKTIVWVSTRQKMAEVAALLLRHEISSAPVVEESGCCVGIISATDFLRRDSRLFTEQLPTHRAKPAWEPDDVVASFMTTGVQTIDAHLPILQAANIICNQHVHRLPVVDRKGRPVGVISTMDIVAAFANVMEEYQCKPREILNKAFPS